MRNVHSHFFCLSSRETWAAGEAPGPLVLLVTETTMTVGPKIILLLSFSLSSSFGPNAFSLLNPRMGSELSNRIFSYSLFSRQRSEKMPLSLWLPEFKNSNVKKQYRNLFSYIEDKQAGD